MHIRTGDINDFLKLKSLYLAVAENEGGLVRLSDEITDTYINNFIKDSLNSGLILVAEHPDNEHQLVAEVHAYASNLQVRSHVLSHLTLVVNPNFQGKKLGRTMLTIFLEEIAHNKPDVGKVELNVRESNLKAITLYESMGFSIEGRLEMRIKTSSGSYEADIAMGWQNPNYEFD